VGGGTGEHVCPKVTQERGKADTTRSQRFPMSRAGQEGNRAELPTQAWVISARKFDLIRPMKISRGTFVGTMLRILKSNGGPESQGGKGPASTVAWGSRTRRGEFEVKPGKTATCGNEARDSIGAQGIDGRYPGDCLPAWEIPGRSCCWGTMALGRRILPSI
jgi:hypothetical protein